MAQGGPFVWQGASGAPEGYGAMIRVGITDARFFLDVKDAFLKLQRAGLWWKGLHADLLDGHHAADFQAACDFLTELCTMADDGTGAAVVYDPVADFAIILDATDGLPKFSVVVGGPTSATSGNLASFDGTTGKKLADSGVVAANAVTAAATVTLGKIVVGAGTKAIAVSNLDLAAGGSTIGDAGGAHIAFNVAGNAITIGTVDTKITAPGTFDPKAFGLTKTAAASIPVPASGQFYLFMDLSGVYQVKDSADVVTPLKMFMALLKGDVGLGNVDNTSDANKPVSTATQTALDAKQATLVSGTTIKTINGDSVLGSGDLSVSGTANVKQAEIDFGATPVAEASFDVTDADVDSGSLITGSVAYVAPTGKDLDELEMDGLDLKFAPGSGQLTIYARGLDGYVAGAFKINYLVA